MIVSKISRMRADLGAERGLSMKFCERVTKAVALLLCRHKGE